MATYSQKDFENSRFDYMEEVRLHLYTSEGLLMQTVTGTLHALEEDVDVGDGSEKTLVWIKGIEGYEVPGDVPGQTVERTEGWFPLHDIEKANTGRLEDQICLN